ncbi:unnamed protein product [Didymodactylos carnosus]|nr:unnamed protein product [Didymodactylos carnosus]CAF3522500.1 unnamed protein product [Didymodactylos carnosus]
MDADTIGLSEAYFTRDIHNYFPQSRKARVKTSNSEKRPKSIINSNRLLKNKSPPLSSYSIILTTATETKSLSLPQLRQTTSVSIKREHSFGTQNADDRHLIHSAGIHDTALDSNQYYGSYTIPRVNSWVQRWKTNLEMHTLSNLMRDDPKQGTKKRSTIGKYEYDFQSDSLLSSTASFSQYKTKRS